MSTVPHHGPFVVPDTIRDVSINSDLQASLVDAWPLLSVVLCGRKAGEGIKEVPPCSIILKVRDGRLGFCLSPSKGDVIAFGEVRDPSKGFDALEGEIAAAAFSWVPRKNYRG